MSEKLTEHEIIEIKNILQVFKPERKYNHDSNAVLTEKPITSNEPRIVVNPKSFKTLNGLILAVCVCHGVSYKEFLSENKFKSLVAARTDFVHLSIRHLTKNKSSIARAMNRKHLAVVSNLLAKKPTHLIKKIEKFLFS
tara:strand:- start:57 stop:473 length:417 start_codon:yes stop_codon:yes gene_type:complete